MAHCRPPSGTSTTRPLTELQQKNAEMSLVISPIGLEYALSTLHYLATADGKREIEKVVKVRNAPAVNTLYLNGELPSVEMRSVVFPHRQLPAGYQEVMEGKLGVETHDSSRLAAVGARMNERFEKGENGQPSMVSSYMYFHGTFEEPPIFKLAASFTSSLGNVANVYMRFFNLAPCVSDNYALATRLAYNGEVSLTLVRPLKVGTLEHLDDKYLDVNFESASDFKVVAIPLSSIDFVVGPDMLQGALKKMGIEHVFPVEETSARQTSNMAHHISKITQEVHFNTHMEPLARKADKSDLPEDYERSVMFFDRTFSYYVKNEKTGDIYLRGIYDGPAPVKV